MAEKRDFLDEIIDLQEDWKAVQNPLGEIANTLAAKPGEIPVWNPADFKERPRANTVYCITCKSRDPEVCHRCIDVCPVDAIEIDEGSIEIADTCRKCGLCVAVCPSEAYVTREIGARKLYDRIAGAAASHETAYVTCTRALGRLPQDNEVVLPCVGAVPSEVWLAIMEDYPDVSVYLPLGICDRCRTTTGEQAYCDLIARAEDWAGFGLDLVVDEDELTCEVRRSWKRKEFVDSIVKSGQNLVGRTNPIMNAARMVTQTLDRHRRQIDQLQLTLDRAVGASNHNHKRRFTTDRRKILMGALQKHPEVAENIDLYEPFCDPTLCTYCGACEKVCPTHAIEIVESQWRCEPLFCVQCGACEKVCPTHAIEYDFCDASDIVLPEVEDKERAEKDAEQKAEVERLKEEGRKKVMKAMDMLAALDTSDDDAPDHGTDAEG